MTMNPRGREIEVTAVIWQEGEDFVSLCPEFGVTSYGRSVEEAAAMLQEAVALYLENAEKFGLDEGVITGLTGGQRWTTSIRVAV